MNTKTFIIGRNPNATSGEIPIQVNDPDKKVSGNHCRITYTNGGFFIEDLISTNGTFVDGVRISSKTRIDYNSIIKLGGDFIFSLNQPTIQNAIIDTPSEKPVDQSGPGFKDATNDERYENYNINTGGVFFTFINPFIKYMDNGSLYKNPVIWIYVFFAVLHLLAPVILLVLLIVLDYFISDHVGAFLFFWLFFVFNCWVCFQLLWNRKDELKNYIKSRYEFKATPIIAHFIKTYGEISGITYAITGFGLSLTAIFFFDADSPDLFSDYLNLDIFGLGDLSVLGLLLYPLMGYVTIMVFKFISEVINALPAIANNTKK